MSSAATDKYTRLTATGTALQKHALFFDKDKDGFISPMDTFKGLNSIGFNYFLSVIGVLFLNLSMAWATSSTWLPSFHNLTFIDISNIKRAQHGSDTQNYDKEGNFKEDAFETFWQKWDKEHKGYLTWPILWSRIKDERSLNDLPGFFASFLEWSTFYFLVNEHGRLSKDDVKSVYDGSLFYKLEERYSKKSKLSNAKKSS